MKLLNLRGIKWSGRMDLNHRPPGPEPGALARLRYAPTVRRNLSATNFASRLAQLSTHGYTRLVPSLPDSCSLSAGPAIRHSIA